jgi:hypothetical protein
MRVKYSLQYTVSFPLIFSEIHSIVPIYNNAPLKGTKTGE